MTAMTLSEDPMNPEIPKDRKGAMAYFAQKREEAIANGMRTYTADEINRARQVGWEEVDAIRDNLEKLDTLVPGDAIVLSTGERYEIGPADWLDGMFLHIPGAGGIPIDERFLPLLKEAVRGGAVVTLPGEEG